MRNVGRSWRIRKQMSVEFNYPEQLITRGSWGRVCKYMSVMRFAIEDSRNCEANEEGGLIHVAGSWYGISS